MTSFVQMLVVVLVGEFLRRCLETLLFAFTGPLAKIPGPWLCKVSTLPHKLALIQGRNVERYRDLMKRYGDTVRVAPNLVLVSGRDAVYQIVVEDDLPKGAFYHGIQANPKAPDLQTETDKVAYKQRRRWLSPGFSISYLKGLEPILAGCLREFEEFLHAKCAEAEGGVATVDIYGLIANLASDIISATSLGGSFEQVKTGKTYYKDRIINRLKRTSIFAQFPILKYVPLVPPIEDPEIEDMLDRVLQKRRQMPKEQIHQDLLQILIDTNEEHPDVYTVAHVKEDMRLFMIAGSDTSSTTATFAIKLLLEHPDALQKLVAELDSAFPSKSSPITMERTQSLEYLNAVINEAMRVQPIIATAPKGISRETPEPRIVNGYEIPKNASPFPHSPRKSHRTNSFLPDRTACPNHRDRARRRQLSSPRRVSTRALARARRWGGRGQASLSALLGWSAELSGSAVRAAGAATHPRDAVPAL
ncbi:hypothetical protein BP6252_05011 [Coleophoma cylindrospora]|uniref:Cytochrome P450 n=1 Tax=Coleophoma cylindrospora TaxID=1849047 RepID=A0A3D8RSL4_9HELO|nr:hypothetical protein BP6252_05011 [Coleophoma cylindrospora]